MPTRLQLQHCIFCSRVPSFLMWHSCLIMLSAPNSGKHRMETEQLQFKYWVLVLDFQLCVLHCGGNGLCMQCLTKPLPRHFALDHVHYEMSNFELTELLVPWSIYCVENNIDEKAQRPLYNHSATFVQTAQESCHKWICCTCKQVCRGRCKCFKAAYCALPCVYVMRTVTATKQGFMTGKGQLC